MKKEIEEFLENEDNLEVLKCLISKHKKESLSKFNEALYEIKKQKINTCFSVLKKSFFTKNLYVNQKIAGVEKKYFAKFKDYIFDDKQAESIFEICKCLYIAKRFK